MTTTRSRQNTLIIRTDADIRRGVRHLRKRCAIMRRVHDAAGDPPLRRQPDGFEGLVRTIIAQQVSAASARAISDRVVATVQPVTPARFLATRSGPLRAAGLSRGKALTIRALARAIEEQHLDLAALEAADDDTVRAHLTTIRGIGPWTADIYLMFSLGRADAWSSRDLALGLACQRVIELDRRPAPAELEKIAERWRPWRSVAARLLWHFYALPKAATRS